MPLLDSFTVDHTRMEAPAVRVAKKMNTPHGDEITVFDLRFCVPNQEAIHQRYRPRNGMPVKSFEHWVKEIHGAVNSVLAPALHRIGCSATEHEIQKSLDLTDTSHLKAYDLAQISDFNSLIAISQKLSKPVFAITDQDLRDDGKAGNVFDTMSENRNLFLQQFERLCQRVLILTA